MIDECVCNNPFFVRIILFIYYMCLISCLCDWFDIGEFLHERGILVIFKTKSILVFWGARVN